MDGVDQVRGARNYAVGSCLNVLFCLPESWGSSVSRCDVKTHLTFEDKSGQPGEAHVGSNKSKRIQDEQTQEKSHSSLGMDWHRHVSSKSSAGVHGTEEVRPRAVLPGQRWQGIDQSNLRR